jgi:hypothetical protein
MGGLLFLIEKFSEVENFVDLVFGEGLDQLIEFFGSSHNCSRINGFVPLLWLKGLWLGFSFGRFFRRRLLAGHLGIHLKQLF